MSILKYATIERSERRYLPEVKLGIVRTPEIILPFNDVLEYDWTVSLDLSVHTRANQETFACQKPEVLKCLLHEVHRDLIGNLYALKSALCGKDIGSALDIVNQLITEATDPDDLPMAVEKQAMMDCIRRSTR